MLYKGLSILHCGGIKCLVCVIFTHLVPNEIMGRWFDNATITCNAIHKFRSSFKLSCLKSWDFHYQPLFDSIRKCVCGNENFFISFLFIDYIYNSFEYKILKSIFFFFFALSLNRFYYKIHFIFIHYWSDVILKFTILIFFLFVFLSISTPWNGGVWDIRTIRYEL